MALTMALQSAFLNASPTREEIQRSGTNNQLAHSLGIMLPPDPERAAGSTRIRCIRTPEQIAALNRLSHYHSEHPTAEPNPALMSLDDRICLSEQRSAIVGRGTRRLQDYHDIVQEARAALLQAQERGDEPDEGAWDRPGALNGHGIPYTLFGVSKHLQELTHNNICVTLVS
jgi:hypothetical protein